MSSTTGQPTPLSMREEDLKQLLVAGAHLGSRNLDPMLSKYVWRRRNDGVHIIHLGKTWEKLQLAARAIVAIENPEDIIAVSARPFGQRAVFKFSQYTNSSYIGTRYTPGTFTNQIQKQFKEPRLLIVTDPLTDHQPIKEASYVNIPVIAFANTDAPLRHVDIAIPCNNKGRQSIALMWWLLAREVQRLRGQITRTESWNVMVDLFMYREPEEVEKAVQVNAEENTTQQNANVSSVTNTGDDTTTGGHTGDNQEFHETNQNQPDWQPNNQTQTWQPNQ